MCRCFSPRVLLALLPCSWLPRSIAELDLPVANYPAAERLSYTENANRRRPITATSDLQGASLLYESFVRPFLLVAVEKVSRRRASQLHSCLQQQA